MSHYVSAKHGVVGLMRSLAVELGQHHIRVNSVHPTNVNTPMFMNEGLPAVPPGPGKPTADDVAPIAAQFMHVLPHGWSSRRTSARDLVPGLGRGSLHHRRALARRPRALLK